MILRWMNDRLQKWVRRSPRRVRTPSKRRTLSLLVLEGRSVPSVTPFGPPKDFDAIPIYRSDETTLDGLIRLTPWTPAGSANTTSWETQMESPKEGSAPLSVAAFMGVFLGTAAVFQYDLEADAQLSGVFHGVKV
jgi:hypothetical protein